MDETKEPKVAVVPEETDEIRGLVAYLMKYGRHKLNPEERKRQARQNPVETFK